VHIKISVPGDRERRWAVVIITSAERPDMPDKRRTRR